VPALCKALCKPLVGCRKEQVVELKSEVACVGVMQGVMQASCWLSNRTSCRRNWRRKARLSAPVQVELDRVSTGTQFQFHATVASVVQEWGFY
jgi:hypothetical protein